MQMRKEKMSIKTFLPLKISITVTGGYKMDYTITKMFGFKVIGIAREFSFENSYAEIPKFWNEFCKKYFDSLFSGKKPESEFQKAIVDNSISEFGVCIGSEDNKQTFKYMIAGKYTGGPVPDGMEIYQFPQTEWAKFECIGPMPESIQSINTKIFNEWLPNNPEFEISENVNIEWYSCDGDKTANNYKSGIWIPIKRK